MISLPIPIFVALVLTFLLVRNLLRAGGSLLPTLLLMALAGQCVIVALVQHYGLSSLRPVQPVTASLIPPLAWLAFQHSALRDLSWRRDGWHLLGPAFVAFCVLMAADAIDLAVIGLFAGYGVFLLRAVRDPQVELPRSRLQEGPVPARLWRLIALALIASAAVDLLLVAAIASGLDWLRPWLLSLFSAMTLLAVGLLSLSPALEADPAGDDAAEAVSPDPQAEQRDAAILARLNDLLRRERIYLDPDLSLTRLSRRIGVPAKQVSIAVNRQNGENVSRYINGFRVSHACEMLRDGATVTAAMLGSGFNTKSNFNREFLRVTGQTPTDWRDQLDSGAEMTTSP